MQLHHIQNNYTDEEMFLKPFLKRKPFGLITRSRVHVELGHIFNTYYYINENEDRIFKARRCLTNNCITVFDCNENVICKLKTNIYGTKYVLEEVALHIRRYMEDEIDDISMIWPLITDDSLCDDDNIDNFDDRLDDRTNKQGSCFTMADYLNYRIMKTEKENQMIENTMIPVDKIKYKMDDRVNNKIIRKLEIQYDTTQKEQGKPRSLKIKMNDLILINKKPYYNVETNSYSLNFSGRVTKPSAKNFQVIHPLDPTYITLTFGKESHDSYILDFSYPWTALHAFCVGLSALDHKYGCD